MVTIKVILVSGAEKQQGGSMVKNWLKSAKVPAVAFVIFLQSDAIAANIADGRIFDGEWAELARQIDAGPSPDYLAGEVLNSQSLITSADRDPLDIVKRRTAALVESNRRLAKTTTRLSQVHSQIAALQNAALSTPVADVTTRQTLFAETMAANREAMFANPVFNFDTILANIETFIECRMVECARAAAHAAGGGPVMITGIKSSTPKMVKILSGIKVSSGPWAGKELTGKFAGLELSYDAREILFSATTNDNLWHIFKFNLETKKLDQLTSGAYDDFDPCFLPSGRIAFISTRRGGIGRCLLPSSALTFTLHSMESDGSDIITLSYHETNDWQPSVNNEGMIVYNRWDYFDRHWGTGHHLFLCFPDGRDPRNYHGNYPLPFDVMPEGITPEQYGTGEGSFPDGRRLREDVDMTLRAVPGAVGKYTATAVGHHEGFSGSLILIDINVKDDGKMSQVKRLTPEVKFPEVEGGTHTYGTCWPLDEKTFMCNYNNGLYLLDDKGNRQVIYDPGNLENQGNRFRLRDPFPLRPRTKPPELAVQTFQGKRSNLPDHQPATIGVMNCYLTDSIPRPIPAGTKIKYMRIIQIIPQLLKDIQGGHTGGTQNSWGDISQMSFYDESTGRIPLGVVPVEDDGSVYCEAPAGKALYFQLLDSNGLAVHSMRTVAYTHAGEKLVCTGCHESKWSATARGNPTAFQRAPSKITPEVSDGAIPFNFHRLVEWPVFQTKCLPCHKQQNKGLTNMSYSSVAKYKYAFGFQGEWGYTLKGSGGSRTTPGKFGATASGIWKALTTKPAMKGVLSDSLTKEEIRRLSLWLDMNSNRLCWIGDNQATLDAQGRGEVSWPPIDDVQPHNPMGIEFIGTDNTAPEPVPIAIMIKRTDPVYHMKLHWQVASDKESGIGAYKIYRNSTQLCMVPDLVYNDRTAVSGTSYTYEISAVDRTGKEGPKIKAVLRDRDTTFSPPTPVQAEKAGENRTFGIHTAQFGRLIRLTVRVPEGMQSPAMVTFFTIDGKRLGQVVAKQVASGVFTAEFPRKTSAGMSLCKVQAGPYKQLIRVANVKR
jgi:hypothetical protein